MDDKTLRDAIDMLDFHTDKSITTLITLAQRYLELSGVVGEKGKEIIKGFADDVSCQLAEDYGYNEGRSDTLLAVMHRLDGLEEGVRKEIYSWLGECICHEAYKNRGLKDPQCQRCDNEGMVDDVLTAIRNAISGGAEKGEG